MLHAPITAADAGPLGPVTAILLDLAAIEGVPDPSVIAFGRAPGVATLRAAAVWAAQEAHGLPYPRIAAELGISDHTRVILAVLHGTRLREHDPAFARLTDRLVAGARVRGLMRRQGV